MPGYSAIAALAIGIAHRASNAHHCENPITVGAWAQKEACDRKKTSRDATEPN